MSNNQPKEKNPKTLSESQTLPDHAPDARQSQGKAALQRQKNVERAKRWVDDHES